MAQIEMVIDSVRRGSRLMNEHAVILKEKLAERYLPIYIGSPLGTPIGVHQTKLPIDI